MKKRLAIIITIAIVGTLGGGFIYWNVVLAPEISEKVFQKQETNTYFELRCADEYFRKGITLVEEKNALGVSYCVGVLSYELDALLGDLSTAYNADPLTTRPITEDELRYFLTEGLVEALEVPCTEKTPFTDFLYWTSRPADLVYAYDWPSSGIVAGSEVEPRIFTNFNYFSSRNSSSILIPRNEYEAAK